MDEYALLEYKEVQILLEIGNYNSFHPLTDVVRPLPILPYYVDGIANLDGTISVVIDLAKFLDLNYSEHVKNLVFLQVNHPNGDFILKLPLPKIINESINLRKVPTKDKLTINIPSANYYAMGSETYLVLVIDQFVDFLSKELSDFLFTDWLQVSPQWENELIETAITKIIPDDQPLNRSYNQNIAFTSDENINNIVGFELGNHHFVIDEKYVMDIVPDEMPITHIPNSIDWIRGVVNYQNESIIAIDTAYYLQIEERIELIVDLICKHDNDYFVLNARNIKSIPLDELNKVFTKDFNSKQFPYSNIYRDDNEQIYYKLNVDNIANSIETNERSSEDWDIWRRFFETDRRIYKTTEQYLMGELQSLNTLSAIVGNQQLLISYDDIDKLTTHSEAKYFKEFRFIRHNNNWIPSIDLSKVYQNRSTNLPYGLIVKSGDQYLELRTELAMMNYKEAEVVDENMISHIAPTSKQFGIKNLASSKNGYGFGVDFTQFSEMINSIENEEGLKLKEIQSEINEKFQLEEEPVPIISSLDTGLWEEDAELYLFLEIDGNLNALSTDEIESFNYEVEEDQKVIPWKFDTDENQFFYVKLNSEHEGNTYTIPSTSYLRAVTQDSIKTDKEGKHISLHEEQIPILSFTTIGSDENS